MTAPKTCGGCRWWKIDEGDYACKGECRVFADSFDEQKNACPAFDDGSVERATDALLALIKARDWDSAGWQMALTQHIENLEAAREAAKERDK